MTSAQHTQSLIDFRQKAAETLERINQTGEAEILTVDGEPRAVLMSPTAYDELTKEAQLSRDVTAIRQSVKEIENGQGRDSDAFFGDLRSQLLQMKNADTQGELG